MTFGALARIIAGTLLPWLHMPALSCHALLRRATLLACAVLLVACAGSPRSGSSPRVALVIGNAAYENTRALKNPANDAADMCAKLRDVGFKTLCHTNLRDRAEFDARVKEYVDQLGPNTVGVVYYSGHGVQAGSTNFLIPTAVQPKTATEDPLRVLYAVDTLFDRLRAKPTRFQLVILDACRTDPFATATRQGEGRGTSLVRALETVAHASNGLAPITDAPPETKVLYATASKEAAFDGEGRNGPLTKHILAHIGTRGQTLEEFFRRVTLGVQNETLRDYRKRQTPYTYGSFSGEFCFAGCPGEGTVPPAN